MTHSHPASFANQDLRNRSFKGCNLKGADFRNADIRGCNFSHAQLQDANFEQARAGYTLKKLLPLIGSAIVVAWFAVDALSHMIFGAVGVVRDEPNWVFTIALYLSSGVSGLATVAWSFIKLPAIVRRIAITISSAASGALYSFYYGGSFTDNNSRIAIASAIIAAIIMTIISFKIRRGLIVIIITVLGAIATYGFAFLMGTLAAQLISAQKLLLGSIPAILSLVCFWLTMTTLILVAKNIRTAAITSFRYANLANAKFETIRHHADFSGAIVIGR